MKLDTNIDDMIKDREIVADRHCKYLSEVNGIGSTVLGVEPRLPDDCILNKVTTGCGGTSVALREKRPYVIAVPSIRMIENKMRWAKLKGITLCGVHSDVSDSTIRLALRKGCTKFMVTYDSIYRLSPYIDISQYKLLIDESHNMLRLVGTDRRAVSMVKTYYKAYQNFVFMSATPTLRQYELKEFRNIPTVTIKWQKMDRVQIRRGFSHRGLYKKAAARILELYKYDYVDARIMNEHPKPTHEKVNTHVFMNSIAAIIKTIHLMENLVPDIKKHINLVTGINERNELRSLENLGMELSEVGDVNRINFYTSTAFEGSDISDTYGKTLIVADGMNEFMKYDIESTIPQICGRVRDSIFRLEVELMYSSSNYFGEEDEEIFKTGLEADVEFARGEVAIYNKNLDRAFQMKKGKDNPFIIYDKFNHSITVNEDMMNKEMSVFKALNRDYYVRTTHEVHATTGKRTSLKKVSTHTNRRFINNQPFEIIEETLELDISALENALLGAKPSFKKLCKQYFDAELFSDERGRIAILEPLVLEAHEKLEYARMKALQFNKKAIRAAIIVENKYITNFKKVQQLFDAKRGDFIETDKAMEKLQGILDVLDIDKKASNALLAKFYVIVLGRRTVAIEKEHTDGTFTYTNKQVRGLEVVKVREQDTKTKVKKSNTND